MLEIRNLSKCYRSQGRGAIAALTDVSLTVSSGEFVAVQGPSGCGKSTLLLSAGGLLEPDAGQVLLDGQDLYALSADARASFRAAAFGFVFQQFHLVPYLNVLDNVLAPTLAQPVPNARARAGELIDRLGLGARVRHVPAALSTGERQRTALARALLPCPKVVLADEPTGNLDEDNARVVLEQLADFARAGGMVLLVTHEAAAASYAQRSIHLREGKNSGQEAVGSKQ